MTTIQVFAPALCCSSGVCGVDVDPALSAFAADVEWARGQGAQIQRFNLAQQPMVFAENAAVKAALDRDGEAALPLVVVDGKPLLAGRYPRRDELAQWLLEPVATAARRPVAIPVVAAPAASCCSPAPAVAGGAKATAGKCC
jgi:hypothetical protein